MDMYNTIKITVQFIIFLHFLNTICNNDNYYINRNFVEKNVVKTRKFLENRQPYIVILAMLPTIKVKASVRFEFEKL